MTQATIAGGPLVTDTTVTFRLPDPEHSLTAVRLLQEISRPRNGPELEWEDGSWQVRTSRPPAARMEYQFEVLHGDGGHEIINDPHNEKVAPGAFGDKSVVEFPGYEPPAWLSAEDAVEPGAVREVEVKSRILKGRLPGLLWSPPGTSDDAELPLLVAHDGPEYARYSALTTLLDRLSGNGDIPPLRAALIAPIDRDQTYSASAAYSRALAHEILPDLLRLAPTPHGRRMRMGMGASLGALAMLHVHRKAAATFGSLYLQSGSYFRQRFDKQESGFVRFRRISRFVGEVLTARSTMNPIAVTMTCGSAEENLANNRAVYRALNEQGYEAEFVENPDAHNWVGWRDTFDPHLVGLIQRLWG